MTEERNDAGQFASSSELLTGQAAALRDAGFVEMPDPAKETESKEEINVNEAAKLLNKPPPPIVERNYLDRDSKPVDSNEAISLERAARDLAAIRQKEAETIEAEKADEVAAEADKLRGKDNKTEAEAETANDKSANEIKADEVQTEGNLDQKIEEALNHPQIRQAIEDHVNSAETSRKAYADALGLAQTFARASLLENFPDLVNLSAEQLPVALQTMAQQQPQRFQKALATLNRVASLQSEQAQEVERQSAVDRQNFNTYAKAEDLRAEEFLKSETPQARAQIENEILTMVKEYAGLEPADFVKLFQSDKTVRNAGFQRFMVEAAKYRLIQQSKKAVAERIIPPVQRPGVSRGNSDRTAERVRQLSEKFNTKPNLKNAAEALTAMRRERARG